MPTLKLTDGTTTVDFGNVTTGNYWLYANGYTPKVNGLRLASLGGRGIYEDVEETINFWITDSSAANCYTRLNTLTKLLLQARRFARGEAVSPVKIQYSPDGAAVSSSGSPLEALITTTDDNLSGVTLSPTFDEASYQFKLTDLTVTFRRGVWLQGTEVKTVSAVTNNAIASYTFSTNVDYMSPTDVQLTGTISGYGLPPLFFILGSGSTSIQILNAANSSGTPSGTGWSFAADGANLPRATNVLRYTPPGTTENMVACYTKASLVAGQRYAVLASCRNNSSTTSFAVRASISYPTPHIAPTDYTEFRTIKPYSGSAAPGFVSLGQFVAPITDASVNLNLSVTGSAASGSIDFDTIVIIEVDNTCVLQYINPTKLPSGTNRYEYTYIENQFLTGLTMRVRGLTIFTPEDFIETRNGGDMLTVGTAVRSLLLGTEGTYWTQTSGGAPSTIDVQLTRTRVHLSPE